VPKVVVIDASGWEVVDRWVNGQNGAPPDAQWGASGCSPTNTPSPQCDAYSAAAVQYSNALFNAISMFRSKGAKVVVANSPYFAPPEPLPAPNGAPAGLQCSYWEPYPNSAPTSAGPDCTGDATAGTGGQWRAPYPGVTYRSSRVKVNQFNDIITLVKDQNFGNDPNVVIFPFKAHFNGPNIVYTDYVCPPPYDRTVAAQNVIDVRLGSPTFGQLAWQCNVDGNPLNNLNAILARAPDKGHLTPAGAFGVLQPYLEPCVKALIPVSGGDPSACS
jgi:hypothetical protein